MSPTGGALLTRLVLLGVIMMVSPCLAQEAGSDPAAPSSVETVDEGAGSRSQGVSPAEVFSRTMLLLNELDLVRLEMGMPKTEDQGIEVVDVAPHEVYFQAVTLFKKANYLSFEQLREVAEEPQPPDGTITPSEVIAVVNNALVQIRQVKQHLAIPEASRQPPLDLSKTPTDTFRALEQANHQLNLLLNRRFTPADVYEQLTLAIGYAMRLRTQFPGDPIPSTPPLIRHKRPVDVYRKLVQCFGILRRIAEKSQIPMLQHIASREKDIEAVMPGHVYDMATLLVSELAYLYAHLDGASPPRRTHYPGHKLPSHVYQRASFLVLQLQDLEELVDRHPDWLPR